jgi:translation elongation factor EF-1alpha
LLALVELVTRPLYLEPASQCAKLGTFVMIDQKRVLIEGRVMEVIRRTEQPYRGSGETVLSE